MNVSGLRDLARSERSRYGRATLALGAALALAQAACLGEYVSMAMGGDGRPLVSYADTEAGTLRVAHCEDAACGTATLSLIGDNGGASDTAIARGSDGFGLISYVEASFNLNVVHCENAACTRARVSVLDTGHFASYTSIAIGRDGLGLISYRDHAEGDLLVAHCEDVACTRARVSDLDPDAGIIGEHSAIAIGKDGLGLVAYHDRDRGWLKVAHCADAACTRAAVAVLDDGSPQVPHVGGYVGARSAVAIGPDGLGLVAYQDEPVGDLKVAHCADAVCSHADSITVVDRGAMKGSGGGRASVAFTPDGLGLIAYHGSPIVDLLDQDLRIVRCTAPACTAASVTTLDHRADNDVGRYPSLLIGPDGFGLVAYQDSGAGGFGPGSVKVAHCLDATCSRASVSVIDAEP